MHARGKIANKGKAPEKLPAAGVFSQPTGSPNCALQRSRTAIGGRATAIS